MTAKELIEKLQQLIDRGSLSLLAEIKFDVLVEEEDTDRERYVRCRINEYASSRNCLIIELYN